MSILVTRPDPGGAETAARLVALGFAPVLAPALILTPRALALPPCQAVLVTSRAGARALPPPVPGVALLAVGRATAEAAHEAGWHATAFAEGTAETLAELAARSLDPAGLPLVLAVGRGYSLEFAMALRARGFRVLRRVAYAARPARSLPEAALAALDGGAATHILFHSPRSAGCAITLFRSAGRAASLARLEAIVISPRVAVAAREALAPLAWRAMRIAAMPGEDALLALLGRADWPANAIVSGAS